MRIRWYGQSAFSLQGDRKTVFIDPFGDMSELGSRRGLQFDYPAISETADLVLVTHEHRDHNGVEAIGGSPVVLRATAGRHDSPIGEVVGVASEHDPVAGTARGHNTIFVFSLGGIRIAHFGDFGQAALRNEQADAIGQVDLLIVPVGGGPTADAAEAYAIVERLEPRWAVPMHYRTHRVNFLETADPFIQKFGGAVHWSDSPAVDTADLPDTGARPLAVVPAAP
jgi:L-ascorbate metabolism protein UlaG (beta-lactamase superfamily)